MAEPMPDELGVLERKVGFNRNFRPTNIAQRHRHAQDEIAYARALTAERERQMMEDVQTDRLKQNFYFKTQDLNLKKTLAEQQMEHRREMHDATLDLRRQQFETAKAREKAMLAATALKEKTERLASENTSGFTAHMNELLDRTTPGTDDYKIGILRGIEAFPHADKKIVSQFADTAIEGDEDLATALESIPPGFKASQLRRGVNGKWGFVAKPPEEASTQDLTTDKKRAVDAWARDRDHWQQERKAHLEVASKSSDKTVKAEAQRRAEEAQEQLDRLNKADPREAAPASAPSAQSLAQTAAPTDRLALARQALTDPNASEAHKAAARRILGQ